MKCLKLQIINVSDKGRMEVKEKRSSNNILNPYPLFELDKTDINSPILSKSQAYYNTPKRKIL